MSKCVKFRVDEMSEMLEVYIDDKVYMTGNFWDFDFVRDVPDLLDKLGVSNHQEDYDCEEEDFD